MLYIKIEVAEEVEEVENEVEDEVEEKLCSTTNEIVERRVT